MIIRWGGQLTTCWCGHRAYLSRNKDFQPVFDSLFRSHVIWHKAEPALERLSRTSSLAAELLDKIRSGEV